MNINQSPKKLLLVFNQKADRIRAIKKFQTVLQLLDQYNCTYEIEDAEGLSRRKNIETFDSVVAVGGDGTVLSVLGAIKGKDVKLGIIPSGTANLFAAGLSIPMNVRDAVDILFFGTEKTVDIGKAGSKYFALRVGIGFDADIIQGASAKLKNKLGYLAYFLQGIKNSFKLVNSKMRITVDGKTLEIDANSVIVANSGNMFRNNVTIAPNGSNNDGKLDIFILSARNFVEFAKVFYQVVANKHQNSSAVSYHQGRRIQIESDPIRAHIDGEPTYNTKLDIQIIPNALKVLVPERQLKPAFVRVPSLKLSKFKYSKKSLSYQN